ncbi:hypothetical protein Pmani_007027 [Petrolisthes manimaculis]|uniref:Uncharacterized protein n=1 Tax=Petrolisthes manimaculis TaxID=1843537 RepID=A0AAE1Q9D3_9EUCA|nr:hypothetical protein Pmani_007027 [Petrolisthes manimaculis]
MPFAPLNDLQNGLKNTSQKKLVWSATAGEAFNNIKEQGTNWSPRVTRHLTFLCEFTTDIHHIRVEDNTVADALSRLNHRPLNTLHPCHHTSTLQTSRLTSTNASNIRSPPCLAGAIG